jgi:hypothetical protein
MSLSDYESGDVCLVCSTKIDWDKNIGGMTPRLDLLLCKKCMGFFNLPDMKVIYLLIEEIVKLRSLVKKLTPKKRKMSKTHKIGGLIKR